MIAAAQLIVTVEHCATVPVNVLHKVPDAAGRRVDPVYPAAVGSIGSSPALHQFKLYRN